MPDRIAREGSRLPFRGRQQAFALVADADVELVLEAQRQPGLADIVHARAVAHGVEIDVAGVLDRVVHVLGAMPPPASLRSVARPIRTRAEHRQLRIDAGFQQSQRRGRLEGRSRREGAVQRLVQQRLALIVGQRAIGLGGHPADEQVRIERRRRDHAQNVAVAHVHDDAGARLVAKHFQRPVLNIGVQRQDDFLARHGGPRPADVLGDDAASCIDLDPIAARLSAQRRIQSLFHALAADAEAGIEQQGRRLLALVPDRLDVPIRHLGHIADDVSERSAERIVPRLVHIDHHAGQFVGVLIDLGELLPGQVALDRHRVELGRRIDVADDRATALQRVGQQPSQKVQRLVQILGLVAHHQHTEAGAVAGDDDAVAVLDQAARRRDHAKVELVLRRQGRIFLSLNDLQLAQPSDQRGDPQRRRPAQHEGAPQEGPLTLIHIGKEDGGLAAHRNRISPSSNRSSIQLAIGNSSSVGTTCPTSGRIAGAFVARMVTTR